MLKQNAETGIESTIESTAKIHIESTAEPDAENSRNKSLPRVSSEPRTARAGCQNC